MNIMDNIFWHFIPRCKYLRKLNCTSSIFSVSNFVKFLNTCGKDLTHLKLSNSPCVNNLVLFTTSNVYKNLKELYLGFCGPIRKDQYEGFSYLKNLKNLELLNIDGTLNLNL